MRGQLLITVYFKGGRKRPHTEARRILKHFGKDIDGADYSYSITRHVVHFKGKTSVRTIGLVLTVNVEDIKQGLEHAKKLRKVTTISEIEFDVVLYDHQYLARFEDDGT